MVKSAPRAASFTKQALFSHRCSLSERIASFSRFSISPIFISGRLSLAYHATCASPVLRPLSRAESEVRARQQYFCPGPRPGFRFPVVRPLCESRSGLRVQWYVSCFLINHTTFSSSGKTSGADRGTGARANEQTMEPSKLTNLSQRNNEAIAVAVLFARLAKVEAQISLTSGRPLVMLIGRPGHRPVHPTSLPPSWVTLLPTCMLTKARWLPAASVHRTQSTTCCHFKLPQLRSSHSPAC